MKKTKKTARLFCCARCFQLVAICSPCDRGNIYCGSICSGRSRALNHRIANQKYQHSLKGRLKHAQRQQRYRERQKATAKNVTDHGSPALPPNGVLPDRPNEGLPKQAGTVYCHFCSESVSFLLRYGFLRHHVSSVSSSWPLGP